MGRPGRDIHSQGNAADASEDRPTKDPEFCGKHQLVDETIVVNKDNKGLANVVVYLIGMRQAQDSSRL